MKAPADFIIDHETLALAKKGGEGDLVVNQYGTFTLLYRNKNLITNQ